jgi:hypothetical protein
LCFAEGIDLSITLIGTPFEPDEDESKLTRREREERAKEKYTPLWKQEVFTSTSSNILNLFSRIVERSERFAFL